MTKKSNKILLVEGEDDKYFFTQFIKCYCNNLSVDVQVLTPKELAIDGFNNKQGAFNKLELLSRTQSEAMSLGLVVDADKIEHGGGCEKTIKQLNNALTKNGFNAAVKSNCGTGYFFNHVLHKCGVWVMPNNKDEGIIEDLLIQSVRDKTGQSLLQHAKQVVDSLPTPHNFKPHKISKAYLATWLAWQENPKETSNLFNRNELLINDNRSEITNLKNWLVELF